jgi:type IV pilus assembly protein PilV
MALRPAHVRGFALIESMVTIVVIAFGLLGVAGLVSRSFVTETEANQRTQAALLLQDMTNRIEANRGNAVAYVTGDAGITGYVDVNGIPTLISCDPADPAVDRDRCQWGRMLAGADEQIDARNASMLPGAIGCIYELDAFNRVYAVSPGRGRPQELLPASIPISRRAAAVADCTATKRSGGW